MTTKKAGFQVNLLISQNFFHTIIWWRSGKKVVKSLICPSLLPLFYMAISFWENEREVMWKWKRPFSTTFPPWSGKHAIFLVFFFLRLRERTLKSEQGEYQISQREKNDAPFLYIFALIVVAINKNHCGKKWRVHKVPKVKQAVCSKLILINCVDPVLTKQMFVTKRAAVNYFQRGNQKRTKSSLLSFFQLEAQYFGGKVLLGNGFFGIWELRTQGPKIRFQEA